ncbi:hypothetical protein [Wenxinia marina]|uniref:hypothetical protein n=1 Tax=Wenxinia marina TaxID=390641 RepID=UPI0012DFF681|nr:hypothetical protein [Wenxinia marina]GGL64285.1 hypothetical protein GCM10011392_18650 [Wenxinia marina]
MHLSASKIAIIQDLKTRSLRAYHDQAFLWSKSPTDVGSADEVADFYTVTLIRFIEFLETSSAHQRLDLMARSHQGIYSGGNGRSCLGTG